MRKNEIELEDILYESLEIPQNAFDLVTYNNSHYFLLPLFGIKQPISYSKNYVGTFVRDDERDTGINKSLIVMFRFADFNEPSYLQLVKEFELMDSLMFTYFSGYNNGNLVAFFIKAPEEIESMYDLIVNGKYSKLPVSYLSHVQNYPFPKHVKKRIQAICLKEEWHKNDIEKLMNATLEDDCELWVEFEPEREVFRYAK